MKSAIGVGKFFGSINYSDHDSSLSTYITGANGMDTKWQKHIKYGLQSIITIQSLKSELNVNSMVLNYYHGRKHPLFISRYYYYCVRLLPIALKSAREVAMWACEKDDEP